MANLTPLIKEILASWRSIVAPSAVLKELSALASEMEWKAESHRRRGSVSKAAAYQTAKVLLAFSVGASEVPAGAQARQEEAHHDR